MPRIMFTVKILILFIMFFSNIIEAGTTGKIKGKIVDNKTGEALIGVNVLLDGTTLGAATDIDGFYIILNIPPGKYKLKVSYIGFASILADVNINVDLTTTQNFNLVDQTVGLDLITVTAETPAVTMDRTNSSAKINAEQINDLPVQNLNDLVQLQAGVVLDTKGGIHIRGGRSNEVAYLVDGVPISNQFASGGGSLLDLESGSIQELQVISGTFNAEYGQAQSGVINVVTKDPQDYYSGSVTAFIGDRISSNSNIFIGVNEFRPTNEYNLEGNFTGPIPGINKLGFYVYGRYTKDDGYLYGQELTNPEDAWNIAAYDTWFSRKYPNDPGVQNAIIEIPDSLLTGDHSFVPMNPKERLFMNFKLNYSITPTFRLGYNLFLENENSKIYNDNYRYTPMALKNLETNNQIHIFNINHTVTPSMFYNISFSMVKGTEKQYLYDDIIDSRLQTVSPTRDRFYLGGTNSGITNIETEKYLAKIDLTWQVDNYNLLKIGGNFIRHRVSRNSLTPEFSDNASLGSNFYPIDSNLSFEEFLEQSKQALLIVPQLNTLGETGFSDISYTHNPTEFALFVQNTLEIDELIINLGLRYDWFNPDHQSLTDPRVNPVVGSVSLLSATTLEEVEIQSQFSPRIGIAYPISENGVVHVAYGHFFKTPPFEYIYDNSEYKVNGIDGPIVGNANLKPQKTIAYEVGLQQEVFPRVSLDVTLFYSDFTNLIGLDVIRQIGNTSSYLQRTNIDNATNQGFTVALEKLYDGGIFTGGIDYTYQVGKGNESDPDNIAIIQTAGSSGGTVKDAQKEFIPLDWNQTHTLNGTIAMNFDEWTVSFIGRFQSGQPYTPTPLRLDVVSQFKNTDNKPVQHSVDMFVRKEFKFGDMGLNLFLKVYNIYDAANELTVFSITGRASSEHRYPLVEKLDEARLVGLFDLQDVDTHQNWFSQPRRIELGLTLSF
ncbi:MAG: TonB-dependent receptor [Labilibaculum sp.]|nr:TonB-dependent receptor [Labilibaculum sp.]MBI9060179.1 TonB-dependent receptor [Labilibaculum sp.]